MISTKQNYHFKYDIIQYANYNLACMDLLFKNDNNDIWRSY